MPKRAISVTLIWKEVPMSSLDLTFDMMDRECVILPTDTDDFTSETYRERTGLRGIIEGAWTVNERACALRGTNTAMVVSHV